MLHSPVLGSPRAGDEEAPPSSGSHGVRWLVIGCLAGLCVPLVVALVGFRRPPWTPVLDLAMTELRVRDVGGRHSPLIGLPGRIGTLDRQGSHPGPLSFYALAPIYRLLGSSAWALQAATFVVHAVAIGTALAIAARRAGPQLVVAVAALLAALTAGYGGGALTEPWNPYLPVLWWVVVLLAVWSVLCGDLPMLPVIVVAGSFCAQTHVPYLGLCLGLGALALGAALLSARSDADARRGALRWIAVAAGIGVVLWLPPTIDQLRHDPGNYDLLLEHFTDPPEEPGGLGEGVRESVRFFDVGFLARADATDPGGLVTASDTDRPSPARGVAMLVLWAAAAVLTVVRHRSDRSLLALHGTVAAGAVLMVLAISRIFGVVWYYLTLWGWAIGLLALLAVGWTVAVEWADRVRDRAGGHRARTHIGTLALGALAVAVVIRFAVAAPDSTHADPTVAAQLQLLVDDVADGLQDGLGATTGTEGRYLLTWSDALHIGSQGFGLLNELERRGFDVGLSEGRRVPATAHRVLPPGDATARIHLATGVFVERYAAVEGAVQLAAADPRTAAQRAEQADLRDGVIAELEALGLGELVPILDENLFGAAIDERLSDDLRERMGRMLEIGGPLAVFVLPMDTADL